MQCPECQRQLDKGKCRCGWIAPQRQPAHQQRGEAPVTAHGSQCIEDVKRLLARPNKPSKQWARDLLARADISPTQRELATAALASRPGLDHQDDEHDGETLDD